MGIPILGNNFDSDDSSDEEYSDDDERGDEEIGGDAVVPIPHAVVPRFNTFRSRFHAMAPRLTTSDAVVPRSSTNETSKKRTAAFILNVATAATDSSKKQMTRAEFKGLDNRPAWMVRVEREKLLFSSSVAKADLPPAPSMSWGKPKSTEPSSAKSALWGKPQSTGSCSANSMSWGKTQSTEPTTSNEWTYRTFKSNNW
jgi:hypothetical protein